MVCTAACDQVAVRTIDDAQNAAVMAIERFAFHQLLVVDAVAREGMVQARMCRRMVLGSAGLPYLDQSIDVGRHQPLPIRAKAEAKHLSQMFIQNLKTCACCRLP